MGELLTETKRPIKMDDNKVYQLVTVKRRNEGVVSRGFFKGKDILVKNYFQLQTGDYLISKRQVVHGANGLVPPHLNGAIVSNEYLVSCGNQNITTDFLSIISKLPLMYRAFFLSSYGIDIEKLVFDVEDWKKRSLIIPTISEQNMISSFFRTLDDTIVLHQRKLDLLKQLKTAYLQQLFPQNDEKVPRLRFADFSGDWEQRKLVDVADIIGGGTPSTSNPEYWDGKIDWYAPAEIGEQIYVSKSQKTITELGQRKSSAKILPAGTVLFTSRAGIGNTAILAKQGTTNQGFQSIVPHQDVLDSYFIFSYTHELKKYGETAGAGSTFVEVSGKQMAKMPILIPNIHEQRIIGSLFELLDQTITLHQKNIDALKKIKLIFLKLMFI